VLVLTTPPNPRDEPVDIDVISLSILTKINYDLITIRLAQIIRYAFIFSSSDCCEGDVGRGKWVKKINESS